MSTTTRDRYISFEGLDCDANAASILNAIERHIAQPADAHQWAAYFTAKLDEKQRMGVDDLFFVGSQLNNLYAFLEACGDKEMLELLYQVEQECC